MDQQEVYVTGQRTSTGRVEGGLEFTGASRTIPETSDGRTLV